MMSSMCCVQVVSYSATIALDAACEKYLFYSVFMVKFCLKCGRKFAQFPFNVQCMSDESAKIGGGGLARFMICHIFV